MIRLAAFSALLLLTAPLAMAADSKDTAKDAKPAADGRFTPEAYDSEGSVTVGGSRIDYQSVAGTLVVHPKGWDDVPPREGDKASDNPSAEASMFYAAYFKKGAKPEARPITFLYNGGPGSATVWLHMGAFGPRRIVTPDAAHGVGAPYQLVNNDASLLDASDLVFIDAPGTGFSRIAGKGKEKAFYGIDADATAFANFVTGFLTKYGRWNSPKYLFGESYGTLRSAVLVNMLETERDVDFNGVILLSQILNYQNSVGRPQWNPGTDLPYELALPTYAATAWYHKKLPDPQPKDLTSFIADVENFATHDYALALLAGAALPPDQFDAIAMKLHDYTGLPLDYVKKADLRIDGGEFEKMLQDDTGTTTGRLDTRFSGPSLDPLSEEAEYDPQSAALGSAYISIFNDYVRHDLKFAADEAFKQSIPVYRSWNRRHQPPGADWEPPRAANVLPDLASAIKYNPRLKVQLNTGYYDLATPFFEGIYEMQHLPMPAALQANVEVKLYESGHMVYAHEAALKQLHDNVAGFIRGTDNLPAQ